MTDLKTYAAALQKVSKDPGAAWRELAGLAGAVSGQPELKRGLIDAVAQGDRDLKLLNLLSTPVARLVRMMVEEGSLDKLPDLVEVFGRILREAGYVRVQLESVSRLSPGEERRILKSLSINPGRALLTTDVEESLLGGVRVSVDDRVYDATIGGRVNRIEEALSHG